MELVENWGLNIPPFRISLSFSYASNHSKIHTPNIFFLRVGAAYVKNVDNSSSGTGKWNDMVWRLAMTNIFGEFTSIQ